MSHFELSLLPYVECLRKATDKEAEVDCVLKEIDEELFRSTGKRLSKENKINIINRLQFICQGSVFSVDHQRRHRMKHRPRVLDRFDQDKVRRFISVRINHPEPLRFQVMRLQFFHHGQHLRRRVYQEQFPSPLQDFKSAPEQVVQRVSLLVPGCGLRLFRA